MDARNGDDGCSDVDMACPLAEEPAAPSVEETAEAACVVAGPSSAGGPAAPVAPLIPPHERYAVGDHCYFELSASAPYQIRRLEELVRDDNRIDVKVFVYSRKCDLPASLQRHMFGYADGEEEFEETAAEQPSADGPVTLRLKRQRLTDYAPAELVAHAVAGRELFLTQDSGGPIVETLPTALIRGKCRVLHHSQGLGKGEYAGREDTFFCERVWLLPEGDRAGELVFDREKRIHFDTKSTYQAVIPPCRPHPPPDTTPDHATLQWTPGQVADDVMETFIGVTMAVGLMARVKSQGVVGGLAPHSVARLARRDCMHTLAADLLHRSGYELRRAVAELVGCGSGQGLQTRRTLLETFDDNDLQFFQMGLQQTGRNLKLIHQDWLPWRKYSDIVCFYYLYKGTDLYKEYRLLKASERRQKKHITSVHVPPLHSKACLLKNVSEAQTCYGCLGPSKLWYAWVGLSLQRRQVRPLCSACWSHWKRYACLQRPWKRPAHPATPVQRAPPHCTPSKPSHASASKQHLLAHRPDALLSPPPSHAPAEADDLLEEQEFSFVSGAEWVLMRRVASEALYAPRQVALYPQLAVRDVADVEEWFRACPGVVVGHYQKPQRKRRLDLEAVISRVHRLRIAP